MTKSIGEVFRVESTAVDFNGEPMTPAKVTSVQVLILNKDKTVLIDETDMTWNATEELWEYIWDGSALTVAGTYFYKVTYTGIDGLPSFEEGRVRLQKKKVVPAV